MADSLFGSVSLIISGTTNNSSYSTTNPADVPLGMGAYSIGHQGAGVLQVGASTAWSTTNKYYGRSLSLGSSSATTPYLAIGTANADAGWLFALDGKAFCMEAWVYTTSLSAERCIMTTGISATGDTVKITVYVTTAGSLRAGVYTSSYYTADGTISSSNGAVTTNTWYHVAITRNATTGVTTLYLNGTAVGTDTRTITSMNAGVTFGGGHTATTTKRQASSYFNDIRVTLGEIRYTANFTAPGALCKTISGVVLDEDGDPFSTYVIATPRLRDGTRFSALSTYPLAAFEPNVWSTVSSASDGSYSLFVPDAEMSVLYQAPGGATLYNDKSHRVEPG